MPTTNTWTVKNPTAGVRYYAPNAYWVIPSSGTSLTATVQAFNSNGQPLSVTTLSAIIHNQTAATDVTSAASGASTASATSSTGTNGTNVFAPGGMVSDAGVASLTVVLSYTGSLYDQPPLAPTSLTPAGITNTLSPPLAATFQSGTLGDTLAQYEVQVYNGLNGGGSQLWDSGNVAANSGEKSAGQLSRAYGGPALSYGSNYSWRARTANQNGLWGPYSGWSSLQPVQGPNQPAPSAPSGQVTTLTPAWSWVYTSPTATALAHYDYQILTRSGIVVYDSGSVANGSASGSTISGSVPSAAGLQYGQQYTFSVTATDASGGVSAAGQTYFSTAGLPQVAPASPIGGSTVNTTTPTFTWTFSDVSYTQASYQVQVYNDTTGALLKDTGTVASASGSYTLAGTTIPAGTKIRWRVQVTDSAGLASGYSAWGYASVLVAPTVTVTNPVNNTQYYSVPTINWTYTASSGGYAQASALIQLLDGNGNALQSWTQTGTSTSFTLPGGTLTNLTPYQIQVSATDTNGATGISAPIAFSLNYAPPADMQGQPLAYSKNYIVSPYMNVDTDSSGVADNWSTYQSGGTYTSQFVVDPSASPPVPLASGDGNVVGAQKMSVTAITSGTGITLTVDQSIAVATAGFVAGSDKVSLSALVLVAALAGAPSAYLNIIFKDSSYAVISQATSSQQYDTTATWVRLYGPQQVLIPATCAHIEIDLRLQCSTSGDLGSAWWSVPQLEVNNASHTHPIVGDMGTGYVFDTNSYSIRNQIAGQLLQALANPGADSDPVTATGGSVTVTWDTTLADSRFVQYLIERRPLSQQTDDSAWATVATVTTKTVNSLTDYTAGGNTAYQYSVRQQIAYSDGTIGYSRYRALVAAVVNYSPAWYLVSTAAGLYNLRLTTVDTRRKLTWKETAVYSQFLGRVGHARDSGPPLGYEYDAIAYYDDAWGDNRAAVRMQWVAMQRLNVMWYLKDPEGLVVPVFLQDVEFDEQDEWSDTLLTVTAHLVQAQDTTDY